MYFSVGHRQARPAGLQGSERVTVRAEYFDTVFVCDEVSWHHYNHVHTNQLQTRLGLLMKSILRVHSLTTGVA